jgi:hypothetical protein
MKGCFILRTRAGQDVKVGWRDIEPTGEVENGEKVFRLIKDDTEGFKITGLMLEIENKADAQIMYDWLSQVEESNEEVLSGMEALMKSLD